ncbi:site-specific DNA-methyltransferase [Erythrobacter sp. KY5]|uniref:site-specific DNA-methyltransferase n=1 Tax=Erythrobacter sp. KY5 TaxID=2011159 RepID=UPI000DBF106B|nr:site-specific DNA-methyltransferase [Erythrobacter sp. KY5]AWW74440.1 site-specific DNA-methyltransferase [Erythrobacter sp. KY5]
MPILSWLTREQDVKAADSVPYRLLERDDALSHGDPDSGNMLIQGDNLEALKALLPYYRGQVKCIYIDPPYNTRSAFEHYDDNLEHSRWLAMMWPRLEMLRELLAEDGSIWVSIDDNEGHYLKVIMDEVFGRENFVASFVWERDAGGRGDAAVSVSHDYIHCFALNREIWDKKRNLLPRTETQSGRFKNPDNDPRGPWRQGDDGTAKSGTEKQRFPITLPSGRVVRPKQGRYWAFSKETFEKARKEGRAYFGKDGNRLPLIKRYLDKVRDGVAPRTWLTADDVGTNQSAKRDHLRKLLPNLDSFDTPKPEGLMERFIHVATNPGDVVLDSFLGSGTTAAVAHKMGRRWIGVEMGDHAHTHCVPRLKKVIEGEQGGISEAVEWKGGGGFAFYRLGGEVFAPDGTIAPGIKFAPLAAHIWFAETGTPMDGHATTPFLGAHDGTGIALLYNGILGDKSVAGGNVLTRTTLGIIREAAGDFGGQLIVYGEASRIGPDALKREGITFKQTPYDVKAR